MQTYSFTTVSLRSAVGHNNATVFADQALARRGVHSGQGAAARAAAGGSTPKLVCMEALGEGYWTNATGRVADGARSAESDVLDFHIGGTMFTLAGVALFDLWAQIMGVLCVLLNST